MIFTQNLIQIHIYQSIKKTIISKFNDLINQNEQIYDDITVTLEKIIQFSKNFKTITYIK